MFDYIEQRVLDEARYIIQTGATVRVAARKYGVSKSTLHKDMTLRLRVSNPAMYAEVRAVLDHNRSERHLRGGLATRRMYELKKKKAGG